MTKAPTAPPRSSDWSGSESRRRTDGAIVARRPLENLDGLAPQPGLVALVAALLGSTAYDGFSNSSSWIGWAVPNGTTSRPAAVTSLISDSPSPSVLTSRQ